MNDTETLLEQWSPLCNMQAFVEANDSTVYFYLWVYPGTEMTEIRSCWVCNRRPAMEEMDYAAMDSGEAPRMPLEYVDHDPGGIELDRDRLSIVWFEEGDAAFLFEGERMIAAIPGWAGEKFPGYSLFAKGVGPFAWELKTALPALSLRADRGRAYWEAMAGDYFQELQGEQLAALEDYFGPHRQYFAIDGGQFPPRALVTGEKGGNRYAFTLGNGALSQPKIEQYFQEDSWKYRRFELGIAFPPGTDEGRARAMLSYVAAQAALPWREIGWLGHGHTIPCEAAPGYAAVLLLNPALCPVDRGPSYPDFMGEPVNLLWVMLLTAGEYEDVMEHGEEGILARKGGEAAGWNLI